MAVAVTTGNTLGEKELPRFFLIQILVKNTSSIWRTVLFIAITLLLNTPVQAKQSCGEMSCCSGLQGSGTRVSMQAGSCQSCCGNCCCSLDESESPISEFALTPEFFSVEVALQEVVPLLLCEELTRAESLSADWPLEVELPPGEVLCVFAAFPNPPPKSL